MNTLSPAAQVVLDAYEQSSDAYFEERGQLAAALRAIADEVVPPGQEHWLAEWTIRRKLLKIAKELEGSDT